MGPQDDTNAVPAPASPHTPQKLKKHLARPNGISGVGSEQVAAGSRDMAISKASFLLRTSVPAGIRSHTTGQLEALLYQRSNDSHTVCPSGVVVVYVPFSIFEI